MPFTSEIIVKAKLFLQELFQQLLASPKVVIKLTKGRFFNFL